MKYVESWEQMIEDLRKDRRAIIGSDLWGGFATYGRKALPSDVLDGYETMAGCVAELYEGFIYRRGSPFNADMNFYITQLREAGLVGRYAKKTLDWNVSKNPGAGNVKIALSGMPVGEQPLFISNLKGAFQVLLVGHVTSLVLFFCEIAYYKYKQTKIQRNALMRNDSESYLHDFYS